MSRSSSLIWDLPTRAFHWLLATLVLMQYGTAEWGWLSMRWHFWCGYATLALIAFRIGWGIYGSGTSRFADFVRGPRAVIAYLRKSSRGQGKATPGHNPLGGWSVLAMLASLLVQAISGLFSSDEILNFGPLSGRVSDRVVSVMTSIHVVNQTIVLVLIGLHLAAVLFYALVLRRKLIAPMLNGGRASVGTRLSSPWWALLTVLVCAALVWALVSWGQQAQSW
ncbi:cytochrome b/b6 domain-containing protein [Oleiagrimonas sp. C23AA]|uniref:cytochrome b/b6 domain-containing protein n=1 Tax=Oleiagrimonas sp. C23AA TaxID=2719047 RepID=UPI001423A0B2|nr:cytochrome b/b6 domain-containing protein [Oleiagrimonas sp. C23AA]NII10017.1 hypothetical protein [Oleiagrimonas sp. C23AA]